MQRIFGEQNVYIVQNFAYIHVERITLSAVQSQHKEKFCIQTTRWSLRSLGKSKETSRRLLWHVTLWQNNYTHASPTLAHLFNTQALYSHKPGGVFLCVTAALTISYSTTVMNAPSLFHRTVHSCCRGDKMLSTICRMWTLCVFIHNPKTQSLGISASHPNTGQQDQE